MREFKTSWFDFVKSIEGRIEAHSEEVSYLDYYRGQPNADWPLTTTLERYTGLNLSVATYCEMIEKIQPEIETFTNKKWNLPNSQVFVESLAKSRSPKYEYLKNYFYYMSYLRHFGFPSPLLDWTHSPFVAAYFAFRDITSNAASVAIYSKMDAKDEDPPSDIKAEIYLLDTKPRNNTRHYLQQSIYTICLQFVSNNLIYASYEEPNMVANDHTLLTKYIFSASERVKALNSLDAYNINAYSLFGTEESLLETISMRKYIEAQKRIKYYAHTEPADWWE